MSRNIVYSIMPDLDELYTNISDKNKLYKENTGPDIIIIDDRIMLDTYNRVPTKNNLGDKLSDFRSNKMSIWDASRYGNIEILLNILTEYSYNDKRINKKDSNGFCPIHHAVRYNHLEVVRILIFHGADVNIPGPDGITCLHIASRNSVKVSEGHRKSNYQYDKTEFGAHDTHFLEKSLQQTNLPRSSSLPQLNELFPPTNSINNVNQKNSKNPKEEKSFIKSPYMKFFPSTALFNKNKKEYHVEENRHISSMISYLLSVGCDVNAKDNNGETALHCAALRNNVEALYDILSDKLINIEIKDNTWMTALHTAAKHGCLNAVKILIENGANIICLDRENMTPLHYACIEGYYELAVYLIDSAKSSDVDIYRMVSMVDRDDQTPIHLAVSSGNFNLVELLINNKANVNAIIKGSFSQPLHIACTLGNLKIVQLLIEKGACIDSINERLETPLHRAALFNRINVLQYLLTTHINVDSKDKDHETSLMVASRKNNMQAISLLLKAGADEFARDFNDRTCLHICAENNSLLALDVFSMRESFLKLKSCVDINKNTSLHIASSFGHSSFINKLVENTQYVDPKNDQGMTPFLIACEKGHCDIIRSLLLKDKAAIGDEDDYGNMGLHLAASNGRDNAIRILLDNGADVDARNSRQLTALDCAAVKGSLSAVDILVKADSVIDPNDKTKPSPLLLASKEGYHDVVDYLLKVGADIGRKEIKGYTCLDLAIENNHKNVVKTILNNENWKIPMRNLTFDGKTYTNPLRKMLRKMPDAATIVYSNSIKGNDLPVNHPLYQIKCNYEFLEDTYTEWGTKLDPSFMQINNNTSFNNEIKLNYYQKESHVFNKKTFVWENIVRFFVILFQLTIGQLVQISVQQKFKIYNPLMIMVDKERSELLNHPLVLNLLKNKWKKYGCKFYYFKLLIILIQILFLTGFALKTASAPYECKLLMNDTCMKCDNLYDHFKIIEPSYSYSFHFFVIFGKWVILIVSTTIFTLAIIYLLINVRKHFKIHLIVEIIAQISTICFITSSFVNKNGVPFDVWLNSRCTDVNRSIGAISLLLTWYSMVLFLRKLPKVGIYVVMYTDILRTFFQFSPVYFLLLLSFAFPFHLLFLERGETISFQTPFRAVMKTFMSMIGEVEFDTFYASMNDIPPAIVWLILFLFIVSNCVVLMNLLVGLAVDDIQGVQSKAILKRLSLQVELVMDVEFMIPPKLRSKLVTLEESIQPNKSSWSIWSLWNMSSSNNKASKDQTALYTIDQLNIRLNKLEEQIKALDERNVKIEHILENIYNKIK